MFYFYRLTGLLLVFYGFFSISMSIGFVISTERGALSKHLQILREEGKLSPLALKELSAMNESHRKDDSKRMIGALSMLLGTGVLHLAIKEKLKTKAPAK